jgi:hypothetical protein
MLTSAFITQIQQRFAHEKRARVCLWFDPGNDFDRLLPAFEKHLSELDSLPFHLLAYDKKAKHGHLWLKRQVWRGTAVNPDARFVLHLPFSEDRITSPDEAGKNHLSLLCEFQVCGVDWKVGGKRPSLSAFRPLVASPCSRDRRSRSPPETPLPFRRASARAPASPAISLIIGILRFEIYLELGSWVFPASCLPPGGRRFVVAAIFTSKPPQPINLPLLCFLL